MPEMREWRVRQGHVRVDPFVQQDRHTAQLERIIQPERLDLHAGSRETVGARAHQLGVLDFAARGKGRV